MRAKRVLRRRYPPFDCVFLAALSLFIPDLFMFTDTTPDRDLSSSLPSLFIPDHLLVFTATPPLIVPPSMNNFTPTKHLTPHHHHHHCSRPAAAHTGTETLQRYKRGGGQDLVSPCPYPTFFSCSQAQRYGRWYTPSPRHLRSLSDSSCDRVLCCSGRVVCCVVLFLSCVCVCDLFRFDAIAPPGGHLLPPP